jgi:hypothetical protein
MSATIVEVQGTLEADGTLVLDEKPSLPAGRVRVTVQPTDGPSEGEMDVIAVLRHIRAEQAASGHRPRSREEIDAEIAAMQQEDEERMLAIERLHEECQQARPEASSPEGP